MEHINLEFFVNLEREGAKSVIDFCMKMGFIASSYECPECKKPMQLLCQKDRGTDGFSWVCHHHKISVKRSVRSGTWFQDSRLSLVQILKLAYLWVKRTSSIWIADELKLSQNTVCEWMTFCRIVCLSAIKKEGIFIGGTNLIVEIDAKSFSIKANKQPYETWVFGGVERGSKKCFLNIIQSGEEGEILSILKKYVLPGTTIISDNWRGFDCLESNGYVHQRVNKTYGYKDPITGAHKNNILCLWSTVKKILSNNICNDQFDAYLAEVMWRRLQKKNTQEQLMSFFKILSHIFIPRTRDDLTYTLKRMEMLKKRKSGCIKTDSVGVNADNYQKETESVGVHADNSQKETESVGVNADNYQKETESVGVHADNCQKETESVGVNADNYQKVTESMEVNTEEIQSMEVNADKCNKEIEDSEVDSEDSSSEEIEDSEVDSEDSSSEDTDESEDENGFTNKRQKTMES